MAVYQAYLNAAQAIADGKQRSLVMPLVVDENGNKQFEFTLMEAKGHNKFDLPAIIAALQKDIITALCATVLTTIMPNQDTDALFTLAIEHRLNEIRDVLNSDLIAQIYALNGWNQDRLPTFEYSDFEDIDSEAFSKAVQRFASVGLMEVDRPTLNKLRSVLGIEEKPVDEAVDQDILTGNGSRSGDGMAAGKSGDGTADIGGKSSKQDKSSRNSDNKG
jgi:hypothetical protein